MQQWKTLSRKPVLQYGRYLTVEEHVVELPDGTLIDDWSWLVTPDFVNVIVIDESGMFPMFRQVKYAIDGTSLAPVGGYIEPGEDPLVAAKREVLEEIGYVADTWVALGEYACDANRGAGTAKLFLAINARHVAQPDSDDLEEQQLLHLTKAEVQQELLQGAFKVLPWSAAVAMALLYLDTTTA
ncbi:MAG: NUDIX hydrolase [Anaerolineaceae bacterium]|nr:NUDIX hydrolase [Anaerolineaceae bacterium]